MDKLEIHTAQYLKFPLACQIHLVHVLHVLRTVAVRTRPHKTPNKNHSIAPAPKTHDVKLSLLRSQLLYGCFVAFSKG